LTLPGHGVGAFARRSAKRRRAHGVPNGVLDSDRRLGEHPAPPMTFEQGSALMASFLCLVLSACSATRVVRAGAEEPRASLTIYNQDFAVARELIRLDLAAGVSEIRRAGLPSRVEPDSVILRDPAGRRSLRVLEQSYRSDPVSQGLLLSLYEGRSIRFLVPSEHGVRVPIAGRVVRSGYVPGDVQNPWGGVAAPAQLQPIIEVEGELRFELPGTPLFPALEDDTVLEPTLTWKVEAGEAGPLEAELAYVTGGFSWHADYNAVAPEKGDRLDLIGWVTFRNECGKTYADARIKLMAGDVSKVQPSDARKLGMRMAWSESDAVAPPVTEKRFDEFHLYSLRLPTTLRDRETKQVEFARAEGVRAPRIYVYDGAQLGAWAGWDPASLRENPEYGAQSNKKIWVMREIQNSAANGLGIPLPKGRIRFYRRDEDASLEFVGENEIDHTPADELLRVYTGNAFDLVGERTRADFRVDSVRKWVDESFEIELRNHKEEAVEVRVVEHLYRWVNWEIRDNTLPFEKKDAQTIEFRAGVPAKGSAKLAYLVHYSW
jgi:hypothetical protein